MSIDAGRTDPWFPESYMKVIDDDMGQLKQALYDVEAALATGEDARYDVGQSLHYIGKVTDNLKLLHQRLNAANRCVATPQLDYGHDCRDKGCSPKT